MSLAKIRDKTKCLQLLLENDERIRNAICRPVCDFVLHNIKQVWCHSLLGTLYDQDIPFDDFLDQIRYVPSLASTLLVIFERLENSTNSKNPNSFQYVEKFTAFLANFVMKINLKEEQSLLFCVIRLFKLITQKCTTEVETARTNMKSLSLRHFLTTSDELPADTVVASIIINYLPEVPRSNSDFDSDANSNFCILAKKYLSSFIFAVFRDFGDVTKLYESFTGNWKFLCLFACLFLPLDVLQTQNSTLLAPYIVLRSSEELLNDVKNLIFILTYDEKIDRTHFCALLTALRSEPILTPEAITLVSGMFAKLQINARDTIKLICEFSMASPNVTAFGSPLSSAILDAEAKGDPSVFEYLSTITPNVLLNVFGQKSLPSSITKSFLKMDRSSPMFPRFIRVFCRVEADGLSWPDVLVSFLNPAQFFTTLSLKTQENQGKNGKSAKNEKSDKNEKTDKNEGRAYVVEVVGAINNVVRSAGKAFVSQFLDIIMPAGAVAPKDTTALKNLRMLSLVLFACDFDTFGTRLQLINTVVVFALSFEGNQIEISQFREFSLFMRVLFIRATSRFIESFIPVLHNLLISGLASENEDLKQMAVYLMRAAIMTIPASFQFTEFAFLPDTLTFDTQTPQNDQNCWPLLKNDDDSNLHMAPGIFVKEEYEECLLFELSQSPF